MGVPGSSPSTRVRVAVSVPGPALEEAADERRPVAGTHIERLRHLDALRDMDEEAVLPDSCVVGSELLVRTDELHALDASGDQAANLDNNSGAARAIIASSTSKPASGLALVTST